MEILPGLILPFWSIIAIITAVAGLLIFIIIKTYLNYSFLKSCMRAANDIHELQKFREKFSGLKLLKKNRLVLKSAQRNGVSFISETGLAELWDNQFLSNRKIKYLRRILKYFPEKGLFLCILGGKNKSAFEKLFRRTTSQSSDLNLLKKIASECRGQDFDGQYALTLFNNIFQDLVELSGDAEWQVRYFGIKLLLHTDETRAERILWESFSDSSSLIRKTITEEFKPQDTEKLGATLKSLLLNDPANIVRKTARLRLDREFPELYRIDLSSLQKPQIIHLLAHLHENSVEDESTAMEYLLSKDLEIRLQAALYLQKQKSLDKLFFNADTADKKDFERRKKLLLHACEVNCSLFLSGMKGTDNPASIMIAAELLKQYGSRHYIDILADKVFNPDFRERVHEHYFEIYEETMECISLRGSDIALEKLNTEMLRRISDESYFTLILPNLPVRGEFFFIPSLLKILKDDNFSQPALLRETFERFPASQFIEELMEILKDTDGRYSPSVKKEAFRIIGELKMPCCLQIILENLKLLENNEQKEFAYILKSFDEKAFIDRTSGLLKTCDSEVKASIISALPATGLKQFTNEIKDAARDSDPDVRTASVWALAGYGEIKTISQMTSMLRDPVERVRQETAAVIAEYGTPAALNALNDIIEDENEVLPVKKAAVRGLGRSARVETVDILVNALNHNKLRDTAIKALAEKTSTESIRQLVDSFKDASPQQRENISEVFKTMGEHCERAVRQLLRDDIASLREILAEILLRTGFIESTVLKLRHKKPVIRKEAAALLALIHTKEAFKGVVLAARDPDPDVRVEVLRALEKLNSPEGSELLKELKEDPDRRVRKYTLWALERLEAKNLSE